MAANRRQDIPIGRRNAISRMALARLWRCTEREARRMIAELRAAPGDDGYAILSTASSPSGYWRSNDPEELAGFIRETESRARNTFLSLRDARRLLRLYGLDDGQIGMFGDVVGGMERGACADAVGNRTSAQ